MGPRTLAARGAAEPLQHPGRHRAALAREFAGQWVTSITDITPQARAIAELLRNGHAARTRPLLPPERPYPVPQATARRLLIDT